MGSDGGSRRKGKEGEKKLMIVEVKKCISSNKNTIGWSGKLLKLDSE